MLSKAASDFWRLGVGMDGGGLVAALSFGRKGVRHDFMVPGDAKSGDTQIRAACAKCGGQLPLTREGRPKPRARYCCSQCRFAAIRDRRSCARADLILALDDLRALHTRIERALDTLELHPDRPRETKSIHSIRGTR